MGRAIGFKEDGGPVHTVRYRVIYGDTDTGGVMYYGHYYRLFEIGRTEFMRAVFSLSYKTLEDRGVMLPVAESYCRYKSPARYDDLLDIATRIRSFSRATISFCHEIRLVSTNRMLATGYTKHAAIDSTGKLIRLPSILYDALDLEIRA